MMKSLLPNQLKDELILETTPPNFKLHLLHDYGKTIQQ